MTSPFDPPRAGSPAQNLPHAEYPVQQLARSRSTRFQMGFARMTMHLLPDMKDVVVEPTDKGLRILGSTELALVLPQDVIRQIYGDDVDVGEPEVRLIDGPPVQEPVMWIRVAVPHRYAEAALHDLIARQAAIEEVDWLAPEPTIRARAALRELLGYPKALAAITDGKAQSHMWLSHYAPLPPEPGQAA